MNGIPLSQLPVNRSAEGVWISFCRPTKFHMKYLQYIHPSWKSKKYDRFAPCVGFLY